MSDPFRSARMFFGDALQTFPTTNGYMLSVIPPHLHDMLHKLDPALCAAPCQLLNPQHSFSPY